MRYNFLRIKIINQKIFMNHKGDVQEPKCKQKYETSNLKF